MFKFSICQFSGLLIISLSNIFIATPTLAQRELEPTNINPLQDLIPPQQPPSLPEQPLPTPNEEILLTPPSVNPIPEIPETTKTITVTEFEFTGNTVFSTAELESQVTANLTNKPLNLTQLLQVSNDIAKLYSEAGYTTSGAVISIPEITQNEGQGIVRIEVIEGTLAEINVTPINESERLKPNYIRSRIAVRVGKPLNIIKLQEALQLLQLEPIIKVVSAQLIDGTKPGTSILNVQYATDKTFKLEALLDNYKSPSVGTFSRGLAIEESNFLGLADTIRAEYYNTDGSNNFETSYSIPFNPYNGNVKFSFRTINSKVITPEFEQFNIKSDYQQYKLTIRQPIYQTPETEISLGLTFDRQENSGSIDGQKFPLSPGANLQGNTEISTVRFFQEWLKRNDKEIIAASSSFNFGINAFGVTEAFDKTVNSHAPNSNYFMWQGQVQYVHLFAPDTLILARANLQLSDQTMLPLEKFVLGGFGTIRGYSQNYRLTDNGLIVTVEGRLPILRNPQKDMVLQLIPFLDFGTGWNNSTPVLTPNTLASIGLGLSFKYSDIINIRLDYGIPLTEVKDSGNTWQENGLTFSVVITP